ncbi:YceD family protein [Pseudogracilibacillus sp. SE30717A]|uniref:YceD family protein n=1 Tax=Pseudogracilibacillus sp. SE30717A TaxID=3098293 RepID=UPI00300DFEA9
MKFSTMEIRNNAFDGPYLFDELVDVSDLVKLNNDIRQINPVRVKGMCTVEKEEFVFSFTIKGEMILPCARTLVNVSYPFEINATEIFSTASTLDQEDEEDGIHLLTEETLDLTPYIMENIILETPYRVFSDEKALEKGEGWSFYIEEDELKTEQENKIDPRFAKLQSLLDENKGNKNND